MIIISNKPGQLGNLLVVYANFLCFGMESKITIFNPSFHRYKSYFKNENKVPALVHQIIYFFSFQFVRILNLFNIKSNIIAYKRLDWDQSCDLNPLENTKEYFAMVCFVQGWKYRNNSLLNKYKVQIQDKFRPATKFESQLDQYFALNIPSDVTIIGVHIRQGDYVTFEGGKYFYQLEQYLTILKYTETLFKERNIHFIICTNSDSDLHIFESLASGKSYGPGHELLDMYTLSRCHFIIGPPSTYTMWASFYGNVPLYMIRDPLSSFTEQDFKIIQAF